MVLLFLIVYIVSSGNLVIQSDEFGQKEVTWCSPLTDNNQRDLGY